MKVRVVLTGLLAGKAGMVLLQDTQWLRTESFRFKSPWRSLCCVVGGGRELGDNRRWTSTTGQFWFCFTLLCDQFRKLNRTPVTRFFHASINMLVFTLSSYQFVIFPFVLIGYCNSFGFCFTTLNQNAFQIHAWLRSQNIPQKFVFNWLLRSFALYWK